MEENKQTSKPLFPSSFGRSKIPRLVYCVPIWTRLGLVSTLRSGWGKQPVGRIWSAQNLQLTFPFRSGDLRKNIIPGFNNKSTAYCMLHRSGRSASTSTTSCIRADIMVLCWNFIENLIISMDAATIFIRSKYFGHFSNTHKPNYVLFFYHRLSYFGWISVNLKWAFRSFGRNGNWNYCISSGA